MTIISSGLAGADLLYKPCVSPLPQSPPFSAMSLLHCYFVCKTFCVWVGIGVFHPCWWCLTYNTILYCGLTGNDNRDCVLDPEASANDLRKAIWQAPVTDVGHLPRSWYIFKKWYAFPTCLVKGNEFALRSPSPWSQASGPEVNTWSVTSLSDSLIVPHWNRKKLSIGLIMAGCN